MPTIKADRISKTTYAEVSAMKFNLKEERCLKKNLQLLGVEEDYSLALINLDSRGVKLYHRRLRDRVAKIKTHLTPTEITEYKILDEAGKLEGLHPSVTPNLHARITAEAKRLNLKLPDRPRTAIPISNRQYASLDSPKQEQKPIRPQSEKRPLSRAKSLQNKPSENLSKSPRSPNEPVSSMSPGMNDYRNNTKDEKIKLPCRGNYPNLRSSVRRHPSERKTISAAVHVRQKISEQQKLSTLQENGDSNLCVDKKSNLNETESRKTENNKNASSEALKNVSVDKFKQSDRPATRPAARMDILPDTFTESVTPSILSIDDAGSIVDLDLVEPSKGKMKLMATKTFTPEEVQELKSKRSSRTGFSLTSVVSPSSTTTDGSDGGRMQSPYSKSSLCTPTENVSKDIGTTTPRARKPRPTTSFVPTDNFNTKQATPRSKTAKPALRTMTMPPQQQRPVIKRSKSSLTSSFNSSKSPFSSHVTKSKANTRSHSPGGRTPFLSDRIDDNLGDNIQAELRKDLLDKEQVITDNVDKKISNFLYRLGTFIDKKH